MRSSKALSTGWCQTAELEEVLVRGFGTDALDCAGEGDRVDARPGPEMVVELPRGVEAEDEDAR